MPTKNIKRTKKVEEENAEPTLTPQNNTTARAEQSGGGSKKNKKIKKYKPRPWSSFSSSFFDFHIFLLLQLRAALIYSFQFSIFNFDFNFVLGVVFFSSFFLFVSLASRHQRVMGNGCGSTPAPGSNPYGLVLRPRWVSGQPFFCCCFFFVGSPCFCW